MNLPWSFWEEESWVLTILEPTLNRKESLQVWMVWDWFQRLQKIGQYLRVSSSWICITRSSVRRVTFWISIHLCWTKSWVCSIGLAWQRYVSGKEEDGSNNGLIGSVSDYSLSKVALLLFVLMLLRCRQTKNCEELLGVSFVKVLDCEKVKRLPQVLKHRHKRYIREIFPFG